jgi:hydrogenase nickel incorporation protein HypB
MTTRIPIIENIMSANDRIAQENRARMDAAGIYSLNLMASPGAGKTSLIVQTINALKNDLRIGMINGDTSSANMDALRGQTTGAFAVHINTGGNCHLEASMVRDALDQLPLDDIDLIIVENVGNLVCPAGWQLGTHTNVLIASVPEGSDKPYKYPGMYRGVDALVLNKIDLLPYVDFDMSYFRKGVHALNPQLKFMPVSCRTGEGVPNWLAWLRKQIEPLQTKQFHWKA